MRIGLDMPPQFRVFGAFFIYSFTMGSLFPRLPDLQRQLAVAEGALGLGLIGTSVGTLLALTFAGRLLERIGYRRSILALIPLMSLFLALATFSSSPLMLFIMLVPVGLCIGSTEIIVNLEADRTEHLIGRRIMNRAHAFWSIGFFASGLLGAWVAQLGVPFHVHLMAVVPLNLVLTMILLGRFDPAPFRTGTSTEETVHFAVPTWPILVLVGLTLSAMLLEGAYSDWSAIYMRKQFDSTPFLAGFAVACGAAAQAVARLFADGFVERFGPVAVVRVLLALLTLGTLFVFFASTEWMALLGFALLGLGSSAIFPLAMSAAAQRTDRPSAVNVAALAQISFVVFLLGPPLLGFIAEHFGIVWSFGIGLPLIVLSFVASYSVGRRPAPQEVPA